MRNVPLIHVEVVPAGTQNIKVDVTELVQSLKYEDYEEKADRVTLYVNNDNLQNFDEPIWRTGSTMILSWGYADAMTVQRLVQIRRVSGFRTLAIEGVGGELAMDRIQEMRTWSKMTHSEIVRDIAYKWGYVEDRVLHIEPTPHRYEEVQQGKRTDAQFVRYLSKQNRMVWYIDFNGFHFEKQKIGEPPIKKYVYRGEKGITEILDIAVEVDVTRAPGSIAAVTYAPDLGHRIRYDARHMTDDEKQKLSNIRENSGDFDKHIPGMADSAHASVLRVNANSVAQVRTAAQSALAQAQKEVVKLRMSVMGDPNVYAKSVIEIAGIGKRLSQRYYVVNAVHSVGAGGYITEMECIADGTNGHSKSVFMPEATRIQMMENTGKAPKPDGSGADPKGPRIRMSPEVRAAQIKKQAAKLEAEAQQSSPEARAAAEAAAPPPMSVPDPFSIPNPDPTATQPTDTISSPPPAPGETLVSTPVNPGTVRKSGDPISPGNIDVSRRPYVKNADGSYSTIRSINYVDDKTGLSYLVPTVSEDGRIMSDDEAIRASQRSGQHLGVFNSQDEAAAYGQRLHEEQLAVPPENTLGPTPNISPGLIGGGD